MANRNYFTLGLDERSCNFCIENLPNKNSKKIYDSILILEKILHKGMLSKASNSLANQLDKYYPKQKRTPRHKAYRRQETILDGLNYKREF